MVMFVGPFMTLNKEDGASKQKCCLYVWSAKRVKIRSYRRRNWRKAEQGQDQDQASRSVFDPAINKSGGGNRIMFTFFCTNKGQTNEGLISLPWCFLFTFIYEIFVKLHQNFAERLKNFNCHQTRFLNPSSEGPRREAVVNINIHPPIPEVFILHPTSL